MFFIMYVKSGNSNDTPVFQVSPISSQSLSSPLSSKKSNQTIVSAKKLHNPLDNEIFPIQPPNTTVCISDNNHNNNKDFQHTACQTVNKKNDKRSTKGKNSGQKWSLCSQLSLCCVSEKSKPAKISSFFTRPNDNDNDYDNNDNHKDTENKQKLITESPDTEVDYLDNSDEATLRLKDSFKTYEERQKYKSIIQDTPLYQIYTEKASISESRRDARRLLALVQPGSLDNPSNNLKFDDELFTAIDGDESDSNNQYSQKVPGSLIDSQQSSIHMKNSERRDLLFRLQNSGSSSFRSRNSDSLKTSSFKRTHSSSNTGERSKNQSSASKPRRQTQEVQNFVNEVAGTGPNRVQWSEMPQVISADLARDLPDYQKKLQEALFEVITSEASYYRTLHILIEKFYKAPCMQPDSKTSVITAIEKRHLFSNISEIFFTSETFLRDMELYFIQNPLIPQLCEIIYEHTENHFENYVKYVQNQMYQLRTLTKLLSSPAFVEVVRSIQQQPSCGFLDLNSFLLLPMQRVTRLRLLLTAILHYAPKNGVTYQSGLVALASIEKLISKCDSEKARMEQKERLVEICRRLEYKYDAKSLATESRTLVKEGDLRLLTMTNVQGSGFHRRFSSIRKSKATIATLFLFSDYLLITKKRRRTRPSTCSVRFPNRNTFKKRTMVGWSFMWSSWYP
ncbi:unnamed protein product [Schistosoma rodhaini]|nr:unnamed protein product [Schistosoma rodhaini]